MSVFVFFKLGSTTLEENLHFNLPKQIVASLSCLEGGLGNFVVKKQKKNILNCEITSFFSSKLVLNCDYTQTCGIIIGEV